ncbi:MAG: cation diffusion facilitator family transporter [Clostridia bacterium]|nr:cation diffusion facilitator family transporter [Clostridia bacterium]
MKLFKRLFIKDWKNVSDLAVRVRYGKTAAIFGLASNMALFVAKIIIAVLSGSISVIADAVNNLSDMATSTVTLIGFKLTGIPADKEHPFGHARYEYVSGLIVAVVMLAVGAVLGFTSVKKILLPEEVVFGVDTLVVLTVAIFVKAFQMLLYRDFGKSIDSLTLVACSKDSRNDVIATSAVLFSAIIAKYFDINIDAYIGLAVSIFVIISGIGLVKDSINPLLGEALSEEKAAELKGIIASYDGVLGVHDLCVHSYGVGKLFAVVHVEVDRKGDIMVSHDLMDRIERDFWDKFAINLTIHMDPVDTDDALAGELEREAEALLESFGKTEIHDFRVKRGGAHTDIFFDVMLSQEEVNACGGKEAAHASICQVLRQPLYDICVANGLVTENLRFYINIDLGC